MRAGGKILNARFVALAYRGDWESFQAVQDVGQTATAAVAMVAVGDSSGGWDGQSSYHSGIP